MYSFEPTDEQKMLIDTIKRFARGDLRSKAIAMPKSLDQLSQNLIDKGWELGFCRPRFSRITADLASVRQ